MEKFAHREMSIYGDKMQTVLAHSLGTAKIAEQFAFSIMKSLAYIAGYYHDVGKYAETFQKRLYDSNVQFKHAVCGALECLKIVDNKEIAYMLAYCLTGHHTGLPDGHRVNSDSSKNITLEGRISEGTYSYVADNDYTTYKDELPVITATYDDVLLKLNKYVDNRVDKWELYAFFTRYLYSCLVDADITDTATTFGYKPYNNIRCDFTKMNTIVSQHLAEKSYSTNVQKARTLLQRQALCNSRNSNSNVSMLHMPTGSGKTLCSLQIALDKIKNSNGTKNKIIYVIPYTSIIEQTASEFETLFKGVADIVQHHTNYQYSSDISYNLYKNVLENWDAPFIITTDVQFFESLYHYHKKGLCKLHNITNAVIVFDEIHTLPLEYLQPCLRGIKYLVEYLNNEVMFLSATMPNYDMLFRQYMQDISYTNLITDKTEFEVFDTCEYIYLNKQTPESIAKDVQKHNSVLIVTNTRKAAQAMYKRLVGNKYHLSTYMTPYDRTRIINSIKEDLKAGKQVYVVSTSLIEVGVDLDFDVVYRELAGLDNILQAGGRCNREGRLTDVQGNLCKGTVYIFDTGDTIATSEFGIRVDITKRLLTTYKNINTATCIENYYNTLFSNDVIAKRINRNNIVDFQRKDGYKTAIKLNYNRIPFRTYATRFNLISDEYIGVVVPFYNEEVKSFVDRLQIGDYSVLRKLQLYTVSLRLSEFDKYFKNGIIVEIVEGVYGIANEKYYNKEIGFCVE